jgi:hypothetical protein
MTVVTADFATHEVRSPRLRVRTPHTRARDFNHGIRLRNLRLQLVRWALSQGRTLDIDAAAVILHVMWFKTGDPLDLSQADVTDLLWIDITDWCEVRGLPFPPNVVGTLHTVVDFSGVEGSLRGRSHEIGALHRRIVANAGATARSSYLPSLA